MANAKSQTLQQRFGFQDTELSTPKHDELMLWLDAWVDTNLPSLFIQQYDEVLIEKKVGYNEYESEKMHIEEFYLRFGQKEESMPKIGVDLVMKRWEHPITDRSYTIGFADMLVVAEGTWMPLRYSMETNQLSLTHYHYVRLFFEVKPTIPSLGEVIRQVRMYQTYTHPKPGYGEYVKWHIVSPDTRFKSQIEAQNIGFVEVK